MFNKINGSISIYLDMSDLFGRICSRDAVPLIWNAKGGGLVDSDKKGTTLAGNDTVISPVTFTMHLMRKY